MLELLGALIVFGIPVALGVYGWKYYRDLRLEPELGELRLYNQQLHQNIVHDVCSHSASHSQQIVHEPGSWIGTDYKKGLKTERKKAFKQALNRP